MELLCNTALIKSHNLNPTTYFFLVSLQLGEQFPWQLRQETLLNLQEQGWIKITPEGTSVRTKFANTFKKYVSFGAVDSWIDDWRDLWPKGVKTMGRLVRGDKQGCLKKMQTFLKDYPEFTKEEIFDATKVYVFDRQRDGFKAMSCADYFIVKNGISLLAAHLEDVEGREKVMNQINGGDSAFHREI